jgi:hypothetical protein
MTAMSYKLIKHFQKERRVEKLERERKEEGEK